MNIGFLLLINFLSIPFLAECELLGKKTGKFPRLQNVIKLINVRVKRWLKLYLVFISIFTLIALSPSKSGKEYPATFELFLVIAVIQILAWSIVYLKIRQSKDKL